MHRDSVFTVYLPSNSPGAESLQQSEDESNMTSSYYKTTLDSTIDLVGSWTVGVCEICFPSKLLSEVNEFKIGVVIVNPPVTWDLELRKKWLEDHKGSHQASERGNPNSYPIEGLDQATIFYGEERPEGIIKVDEDNLNLPYFKPFDDAHLRSGATADGKPQASAKKLNPTSRAQIVSQSVGNKRSPNVVDSAGNVNFADIVNDWILKGPINPTVLPSPTVPAPTIDWDDRVVPEFGISRRWVRTAYRELAIGKKILLEIPARFSGLDTVPKSFYQSRHELVNILNERMALIVQNRSYPHRKYSDVLIEPFFHGRDSGVVSVVCGFADHFNATTSAYTYLSPVIYSEKVIAFLGLNRENWKFDPIIKGFIYTVLPGKEYKRRDSITPILLPVAPSGQKVYETHAIGDHNDLFRDIFDIDSDTTRTEAMLQFVWEKLEKPYTIDNWTEKKSSLLQPKLTKPQFLYLYCDVAAESHIGNMKASVLRITSLKTREESSAASATTRYYQNEPERYVHILRAPVSRKSFNTITIFLSDEFGSQLVFDEGTVYVVLEFKRQWENSFT